MVASKTTGSDPAARHGHTTAVRALLSNRGARLTSYVVGLVLWIAISLMVERIPTPIAVIEAMIDEFASGEAVRNFMITNQRFLLAVFLAVVGGIIIGLAMGTSSMIRAMLGDVVLVGLAIPAVIWAFLCQTWFGTGWQAPVVTATLSTLPFIAVGVVKGVAGVSRDLRDMSAAYRVPLVRRIREMALPAIASYVLAGLRIGLIVGWNGILLSEWFGAVDGVGFRARYWYDAHRFAGFTAWVILFVLYVVLIDRLILVRLERRLTAWRPSAEREAPPLESQPVTADDLRQ